MKIRCGAVLFLTMASIVPAAEEMITAVHGTVEKMGAISRVISIRAVDGSKEAIRVVDATAIHGLHGARSSWRSLEAGAEVVVQYTRQSGEKTALEVDRIGKDGLKIVRGTLKQVDREAKRIVITAANGAEQGFDVGRHAAHALATEILSGVAVTVYYSEEGGKAVAHFFERALPKGNRSV